MHPGMRLGEALSRCPTPGARAARPGRGQRCAGSELLGRLESDRRGGRARRARASRASTRAACAACTAARSTASSWPPRARRCGARRGSARGRRGSARWRPPSRARRGARTIVARRADLAGRAGRAPAPPRRDRAAARRRSSGWGSSRSATSPRCRARRSPIASGRPGCGPTTSRTVATPRCARVGRGSVLEEALDLPESASGPQLGVRSSCSSTACSPAASATDARSARRRPRRVARRGRDVARARRLPRGARRRRPDAAGARPSGSRQLPAPAEALRLAVERFGPPHPGERALFDDGVPPAPRAPARGDPSGPRGRRSGGRAARARRRPGLARARAPRGAHAVRAVSPRHPPPRRPAAGRVIAGPGGRPESVDRHEVDAVRESWLDRGPLVDRPRRCAAATGRWSRSTDATSSSSASSGTDAGSAIADSPQSWCNCAVVP